MEYEDAQNGALSEAYKRFPAVLGGDDAEFYKAQARRATFVSAALWQYKQDVQEELPKTLEEFILAISTVDLEFQSDAAQIAEAIEAEFVLTRREVTQ